MIGSSLVDNQRWKWFMESLLTQVLQQLKEINKPEKGSLFAVSSIMELLTKTT
jgi:hypothetical protein